MILTKIIPGKKFVVKDDFPVKTSGLLPNSTGFVAYSSFMFSPVAGNPMPTLGKATVVLTRKGKKGKDRIESMSITTPILYEETLAKNYPKDYRNIYSRYPVLDIHSFDENVLNISPVDFIAWAMAYRLYLKNLFDYSGFKFKKLPKKGNDLFNVILNIADQFNYEQDIAVTAVSSPLFRTNLVKRYRELESIVSYDIKKRMATALTVNHRSIHKLINTYKKTNAPVRFIKEAEALAALIKRDGQKAVATHIK